MSVSFTSGKFSHDPEPWVSRKTGARYVVVGAAPEAVKTWGMDYAPRPEFGHHNPILAAFRGALATDTVPGSQAAREWLEEVLPEWERAGWDDTTPEHIAHARRVLEKLAALTTTPNGATD